MKTYNQLITELNKFEKMMIQKCLKQITTYPVSKRVVKGFKDAMIKLRKGPQTKTVSQMRGAENKALDFMKKNKLQQLDDITGIPTNPTLNRHQALRGMSKKKNREMYKNTKSSVDLYKPSGDFSRDATAQLNIKPEGGHKRSIEGFIKRQFDTNKLGKPTTRNVKMKSVKQPPENMGGSSVKPFKRNKPK